MAPIALYYFPPRFEKHHVFSYKTPKKFLLDIVLFAVGPVVWLLVPLSA